MSWSNTGPTGPASQPQSPGRRCRPDSGPGPPASPARSTGRCWLEKQGRTRTQSGIDNVRDVLSRFWDIMSLSHTFRTQCLPVILLGHNVTQSYFWGTMSLSHTFGTQFHSVSHFEVGFLLPPFISPFIPNPFLPKSLISFLFSDYIDLLTIVIWTSFYWLLSLVTKQPTLHADIEVFLNLLQTLALRLPRLALRSYPGPGWRPPGLRFRGC